MREPSTATAVIELAGTPRKLTCVAGLALSDSGRHLLHRLIHRFAPAKLKPKVEGLLLAFFEGLHALRNPADLAAAWLMSLISWTLEATMYYMVARAFGIHEGFHIFLLLTAAANLAIEACKSHVD